MVLSAEQPKVFGWSSVPGATIIGTTSDTGEDIRIRTNATSTFFEMSFNPRAASMVPFSITLTDTTSFETVVLKNLLAGDIWVCSGQSNMEFSVPQMFNAQEIIKNSKVEGLRLFAVYHESSSDEDLKDITESQYIDGWVESSPQTVCGSGKGDHDTFCKPHCGPWGYFSATCFAHGLELLQATGRPQGLVEAARGGAHIERFSNAFVFDQCRDFPGPSTGGDLWAGMIAPLLPLPVRGVLWHHGEGAGNKYAHTHVQMHKFANKYKCQLENLIKSWRSRFARPSRELTWITVQVAAAGDKTGGLVRLAQKAVSSTLPGVGLVVTTDLYDGYAPCKEVHFRNKTEVAKRSARAALNLVYDQTQVHWTGPIPKSFVRTNYGVQVDFVGGDGPLRFVAVRGQTFSNNSALQGFEVTTSASLQSGWIPVPATILSTSSVALHTSDRVTGIRYSWGSIPRGEFLYDGANLPAGPFLARCGHEPSVAAACKLIEGGNLPMLDERLELNADKRILFRRWVDEA